MGDHAGILGAVVFVFFFLQSPEFALVDTVCHASVKMTTAIAKTSYFHTCGKGVKEAEGLYDRPLPSRDFELYCRVEYKIVYKNVMKLSFL